MTDLPFIIASYAAAAVIFTALIGATMARAWALKKKDKQ